MRREFPKTLLMVDNCYGEFVQASEPSHHGADVVAGSLIKNPGGGLAPTGDYIAGTQQAINRIAARLTAPGIGLEVGPTQAATNPFIRGCFWRRIRWRQALKTAILAARPLNCWA